MLSAQNGNSPEEATEFPGTQSCCFLTSDVFISICTLFIVSLFFSPQSLHLCDPPFFSLVGPHQEKFPGFLPPFILKGKNGPAHLHSFFLSFLCIFTEIGNIPAWDCAVPILLAAPYFDMQSEVDDTLGEGRLDQLSPAFPAGEGMVPCKWQVPTLVRATPFTQGVCTPLTQMEPRPQAPAA